MHINPEKFKEIDACFANYFKTQKSPGLQYAITYRGAVLHHVALGYRRRDPDLPMDRSISRIASMTKSFATAATLRLRDADMVDIDAPLASIVPHLQLTEPFASASLRNLMAMRLDLPVDDPWADRLLDASNEELDPLFKKPLLRIGLGPTQCAYSNLSYLLLGRIISHVSKRPAMEYISEEILNPLGLHDTVWNLSKEQELRAALGYRNDCDPPQIEKHFTCRSDGVVFGGLWSTTDDLARWLEFLRADSASPANWDSILSKESRRELWGCYSSYPVPTESSLITKQPLHRKSNYGLGIAVTTLAGTKYIAHSGGLPGYGSHMRVHTETGFGAVVLANGTYFPAALPATSALHYLISSLDTGVQQLTNTVIEIGTLLANFIQTGETSNAEPLFAYNFWQDNLVEKFHDETRSQLAELGEDAKAAEIRCVSGYQGEIVFTGSRGTRTLEFQLAPHRPPRIQSLRWLRPSPKA
jgi:CubicO group peptidase (beta-lactamase class C family)